MLVVIYEIMLFTSTVEVIFNNFLWLVTVDAILPNNFNKTTLYHQLYRHSSLQFFFVKKFIIFSSVCFHSFFYQVFTAMNVDMKIAIQL